MFGDTQSPLTLNRFAYALGDPVTLDDPTGLCPPQYCFDKGYHGVKKASRGRGVSYKSGHSHKAASKLRPPQQRVRAGHDPKQTIRRTPKAKPKKPAKEKTKSKPRAKDKLEKKGGFCLLGHNSEGRCKGANAVGSAVRGAKNLTKRAYHVGRFVVNSPWTAVAYGYAKARGGRCDWRRG